MPLDQDLRNQLRAFDHLHEGVRVHRVLLAGDRRGLVNQLVDMGMLDEKIPRGRTSARYGITDSGLATA